MFPVQSVDSTLKHNWASVFKFLRLEVRFRIGISSVDGRPNPEIPTLPFSASIPGSRSRLTFSRFNILPFFFVFSARFFAVFLWFVGYFHPFGILAFACGKFGCGNTVISNCRSVILEAHILIFSPVKHAQGPPYRGSRLQRSWAQQPPFCTSQGWHLCKP